MAARGGASRTWEFVQLLRRLVVLPEKVTVSGCPERKSGTWCGRGRVRSLSAGGRRGSAGRSNNIASQRCRKVRRAYANPGLPFSPIRLGVLSFTGSITFLSRR